MSQLSQYSPAEGDPSQHEPGAGERAVKVVNHEAQILTVGRAVGTGRLKRGKTHRMTCLMYREFGAGAIHCVRLLLIRVFLYTPSVVLKVCQARKSHPTARLCVLKNN